MLEQQGSKTHSITEHDKEDAGNMWIERAGMPHLAPEHLSHPCSHFVTGGAFWLVDDNNPWPVPDMNRSGI
jgi:hypothetical protein